MCGSHFIALSVYLFIHIIFTRLLPPISSQADIEMEEKMGGRSG